jgi:LysM repeat protein
MPIPASHRRFPVRTTPLRILSLLLAVLVLVACTRERETPTPAPELTPGAAEGAATVPSQTSVITTTAATSADPVVETTGSTPTAEATAAETPTPEVATETFDYTVQAGETLAGIAGKFDTEVQTLRELNFLLDDNIFAGQVLAVPYVEGMTAEGVPTATPTPFAYVVQAGDTLSSIAFRFGVEPVTLIEVNNILDPNNLTVGTPLLIPGYVGPQGEADEGTAGTAGGETAGSTGGTAAGGGDAVVHVVQPGESLNQIAVEYGVDPVALAQANNIANGNLIRVGQRLVIPGVTAREALEARGERHVVQSGESLSMIAADYGVSVEAIMASNSLDDPNTIVVGQELLIPPAE